jgi:hypothetical protein
MPRRKPKPEKVIEQKIKESLDSIIMEESLDSVIDSSTLDLPRLKSTDLMDYAEEKSTAFTEAKNLLDSLTDFYVEPNKVGEAAHLEQKKKMDAINISAMMFQLKSAQHAITKILEEIELGNTHPRNFEVLGQLQSQIMQMPKDYQNYMEKMELGYKRLRNDIDQKNHNNGISMEKSNDGDVYIPNTNSISSESSTIKSRGTKTMMEGLRELLGGEIEDVKPIEVDEEKIKEMDPTTVVNARYKKIIDVDRIESDDEKKDDTYELDDDMFL